MNNTEKKLFAALTAYDEDPIAALFTTYNFEPTFFENSLLPDLLQLDTNEEIEENLKTLDLIERLERISVAVLMDARVNLKCERKFPGYELYPIHDRTQHSKLAFLVFEKKIKLFISSANVSKQSIHENKEIYVEFNLENQEDDWSVLADAIHFIRRIMEANNIKNSKSFKMLNAKFMELKPEVIKDHNLKFVPVGPGYDPINFAKAVHEFWYKNPMDGRKNPSIQSICIQSPFFENSHNNDSNLIITIEETIKDVLKTKDEPLFDISLPTHDGKLLTPYPFEAYADYENLRLWENPYIEEGQPRRFPHLKTYFITDEKNYSMIMLGSSNFSPSAFGMKEKMNWEANIYYFKEEYFRKDLRAINPDSDEIKDISKFQVIEDPEQFYEDLPDPVIKEAQFENNLLKITIFQFLQNNQAIKLGEHLINSNSGDKFELELEELNEQNLVVYQGEEIIQIFPITIINGHINDTLKLIPSSVIVKFIEARYLYGQHLKLSEFIAEERKKSAQTQNLKITFDTKDMLLYEIREFNKTTSKIYLKLKAENIYPNRIHYHLNGRFGLIKCIQEYAENCPAIDKKISALFKSLEMITHTLLAFNGCQNEECLNELELFYTSALSIVDSIDCHESLRGQINVYKAHIKNLKASLQKVAV